MELCFFTMSNVKCLKWARRLINSGDVVDRPIWYYRIPETDLDPRRYKIELLLGDLLPLADKYIYMDADCLMLQHGDWESDDCLGVKKEYFGKSVIKDLQGQQQDSPIRQYFNQIELPQRINSGVIVLPGHLKELIAKRWKTKCETFDSMTVGSLKVRDQLEFCFIREEFSLPFLPDRFNRIIKAEKIESEDILIHCGGHPGGQKARQYYESIDRMLDCLLEVAPQNQKNFRWQILTRLIMLYSENPTYPIGAELGVFKGENAEHLLNTFPGLRLHCVDNRKPLGSEKRHGDTMEIWGKVCERFGKRIIYHECDADKVDIPEQLDFAFVDEDHRTEPLISTILHIWPFIKVGGVLAGHDIDYGGTYYDKNSVRRALLRIFGNNFETGPDHTWWVRKESSGGI